MDEAIFKERLARKLTHLRRAKGMDLVDVAVASGVSTDKLEKYEEGEVLPALGELMSLAAAFDVSLNFFLASDLRSSQVEVVRTSERWRVEPQTDSAATLNYSYEALSYRLTEKTMSPFHIEIPPDEGKALEPLAHEGEEFHYILSGQVQIIVGDEVHELDPGDAIYFDSRLAHSVRALGSRPARVLACLVNVHRPTPDENPLTRAH